MATVFSTLGSIASNRPSLSCSQRAVHRGGLLASVASVQSLTTSRKSPRCSASVLGGHDTSAAHRRANQSAIAVTSYEPWYVPWKAFPLFRYRWRISVGCNLTSNSNVRGRRQKTLQQAPESRLTLANLHGDLPIGQASPLNLPHGQGAVNSRKLRPSHSQLSEG